MTHVMYLFLRHLADDQARDDAREDPRPQLSNGVDGPDVGEQQLMQPHHVGTTHVEQAERHHQRCHWSVTARHTPPQTHVRR